MTSPKDKQLSQYLNERAASGTFQGEGSFQLNLVNAAHKLAESALPSRYHYLLRMVQVANLGLADKIEVKIARASTTLSFQSHHPGLLIEPDRLAQSLNDPLATKDAQLATLTSAILGTLNEENSLTVWSVSGPTLNCQISVDTNHRFKVKIDEPTSEPSWSFRLQVQHRGSWKFWQGAVGRAESVSLLQQQARFSPAKLLVDSKELETPQVSVLNEHIVDIDSFRGVSTSRKRARVPATQLCFEVATDGQQGISVLRPSLSAYVVRKENLNLWASAIRGQNSLKPDGESSAAWMLQFRKENEDISMRFIRKRDKYRAVLAINQQGFDGNRPLRIFVVRHGVLLKEQDLLAVDSELEPLRGHSLIFADEELETDLTGLQLRDSNQLVGRVKKFLYLLPLADRYRNRCEPLITGMRPTR